MSGTGVEIQKELHEASLPAWKKYCRLIVGSDSLLRLIKYECIIMLCSFMPGAAGLLLRSKLYPLLLGRCGNNVHFGVGVILRHPHKIRIGNDVVIDDYCLLDAKGGDSSGISIGNGCFIGRNTILSCKNGTIELNDKVNLGFNCEIFSGSRVVLEENVLVAAYTYFVGGGHAFERGDISVLEQERTSEGIQVGRGSWIGAHVQVLDGVNIGKDAIIGAGSVVTKKVEDNSISVGAPAKHVRSRDSE